MKVDTLITKLQDIRNRFGNVEVMIGMEMIRKNRLKMKILRQRSKNNSKENLE